MTNSKAIYEPMIPARKRMLPGGILLRFDIGEKG